MQSIWLSHSEFIYIFATTVHNCEKEETKKKNYMPNNVKIKHSLKYLPIGNGTCCCCCCYYGNFCFLFLPSPFWFLCVLCVRLCWYSGRKSKSTCSAWPIGGNRGEVNRVRSSFSAFFLHFRFSLSARRRVGDGERYGRDLCIVRLFTFNVLRTFVTLFLSFLLFLQILSIRAFYVFSSYDFEYTRHTHTLTHTQTYERAKEKMAAHAKNIHTLELCVCVRFFLHLYWPLFYENFWRDLILAPSQF